MSLQGKVALITGASQSPGSEVALALARAGAKIAVEGVSGVQERVLRTVETFGGDALPIRGDVLDEADVRHMLSNVEAILGPVDILVNASGVSLDSDGTGDTAEDKAAAAAAFGNAIAPGMRQRGAGCVVSIVTPGESSEAAKMVASGLTGVVIDDISGHPVRRTSTAGTDMSPAMMAGFVVRHLEFINESGS